MPSNPPPPVTVPPGQIVLWTAATNLVLVGAASPPATNGSATATANGTSYITMSSSCGLCNWSWAAQWNGFNINLPPGAVINSCYPVILAVGTGSGADAGAWVGGATFNVQNTEPAGQQLTMPTEGSFSGEYTTSSITFSTSLQIGVRIFGTTPNTFEQSLSTSFVGLALYCTLPQVPKVWINIGNTSRYPR